MADDQIALWAEFNTLDLRRHVICVSMDPRLPFFPGKMMKPWIPVAELDEMMISWYNGLHQTKLYIYINIIPLSLSPSLSLYMYIHIYICIHIHIYIYKYIYISLTDSPSLHRLELTEMFAGAAALGAVHPARWDELEMRHSLRVNRGWVVSYDLSIYSTLW
jgi:hypothetical protein